MAPFSTADSGRSPAPRKAIYSYAWSLTTFERAYRSHARGWEILMDLLNMQTPQFVFLIAANSPEWATIRSMVHLIERWDAQQLRIKGEHLQITTQMLSVLVRTTKGILSESLYRYLTGRISDLSIEEQLKKGSAPSGAGQPLSLFEASREGEQLDDSRGALCGEEYCI